MTARDASELRSLRIQFEACADSLANHLCVINDYLSDKTEPIPAQVVSALTIAPDEMNLCRHLISEIEAITADVGRTNPRRKRP